ncbi:hypothetical protein F4805DRAFT_334350 [Annulohypoxylon moriforme]|nr:hypothetical protein F4805DRAFT_334350 [Annulohypoxylon moriforme]
MADERYSLLKEYVRGKPELELNDEQFNSLYQLIQSQPNRDSILDSIVNPTGTFTRSFSVNQSPGDDFRSTISAAGSIVNLWIYNRVNLVGRDIKREFTGDSWGFIPGLPAGALFGTMWYNDASDFEGSCQFFVGGIAEYIYVNFWRGNKQTAVFHAGNVGGAVGGSWGSGNWGKM